VPVNNERNNHQQSSSSRGTPSRGNHENGAGVNPLQLENATNPSNPVSTSPYPLDGINLFCSIK
jgi:hypothetical protein